MNCLGPLLGHPASASVVDCLGSLPDIHYMLHAGGTACFVTTSWYPGN
ncbi:MAG: hypothetical protein AB4352_22340 [Hormoscilla sp.]